jgi:hypothetical protein
MEVFAAAVSGPLAGILIILISLMRMSFMDDNVLALDDLKN